jgi:hypothetical protein
MAFRAQDPDMLEGVHAGMPGLAGAVARRWLLCRRPVPPDVHVVGALPQGVGAGPLAPRARDPRSGGLAPSAGSGRVAPVTRPLSRSLPADGQRGARRAGRRTGAPVQVQAISGRAVGFEA